MRFITTMKLDRSQMPYWSTMLMHGDQCLVETVSPVFNPRNKKDFLEYMEATVAKAMIEVRKTMKTPEQHDELVRMLIQEHVNTTNKPQGL